MSVLITSGTLNSQTTKTKIQTKPNTIGVHGVICIIHKLLNGKQLVIVDIEVIKKWVRE